MRPESTFSRTMSGLGVFRQSELLLISRRPPTIGDNGKFRPTPTTVRVLNCTRPANRDVGVRVRKMRWSLSPGHHSATTLSLGLLVSKVGSDHVLHCDAHSLVYRNLGITKPSRLLTKSHGSKSCSH